MADYIPGSAGNLPGVAGPASPNGASILNNLLGPGAVGSLQTGAYSTSKKAMPTDPVWVGSKALGQFTPTAGHDTQRHSGMVTYDSAQNLPGKWYADDQNFYKSFIAKAILYKLPGASSDMGLPEAGQVWDNLLQTSIQLSKTTGRNWTPWDVMESYNRPAGSLGTRKVGDWLVDNASGEKVKYVGPKSKTTKSTAIDLSDPKEVQAIATQVLTQMIGRAPSDKEMAQFKASLNDYERSHPEVTTTTENYDDQGNVVSTNAVRSGGVSDAARQAVLSDKVQDTKEYGKYQGGTTYFNALMQMIGGS